MTTGSLNEIALFITQGYNRAAGSPYDVYFWNLTNVGYHPTNGLLYYDLSDSDQYPENNTVIRNYFKYLSNVTGIEFQEKDDAWALEGRTIEFVDFGQKDVSEVFFEWWDGNDFPSYAEIGFAYVNIDNEIYPRGEILQWPHTYMHEILHSLGLDHPGPYNGAAATPNDAVFENDSYSTSALSYFRQDQVDDDVNDYSVPLTPMAADFLALDLLYEAQGSASTKYGSKQAFLGDTIYGQDTNLDDPILNEISAYLELGGSFCIVDGGGFDILDFNHFENNSKIDLTPTSSNDIYATSSDINGRVGNLSLAVGTIIEGAVTGKADDILIGNDVDNYLAGNAGNDVFLGEGGDDDIFTGLGDDEVLGGDGNDSVYATYGNNDIQGEKGDDRIIVSTGNNIVSGGDGDDLIKGGSGNDDISGGDGNDIIYGDTVLYSHSGNDTIYGGNGNDVLQGGLGRDTFIFKAGDTGVNTIKNIETGGFDFDMVFDKIRFEGYGDRLNSSTIGDYITRDILNGITINVDNQSIILTDVLNIDQWEVFGTFEFV